LKNAKNGYQAKAVDFANPHFGAKIQNALKHPENVFVTPCSFSMQKTTRERG